MQTNGSETTDHLQEIMEGYRLSAQQRFQWRLGKHTRLPNAQLRLVLTGTALDRERLGAALERLRQRHEILRTTYHRVPGTTLPVQTIDHDRTPEWRYWDLRYLSAEEQAARIDGLAEAEVAQLIESEHGPIVRPTLIQLQDDHAVLVLTLPAVSSDSRSLVLFARELAALCNDQPLEPTDDDVLSYAQYAAWQDELQEVDDEQAEAGRRFWATQQATLTAPELLSFCYPAGQNLQFTPSTVRLAPTAEQQAHWEALCARTQLPLSLLLETAWAILLARLTESASLTLGHLAEGRAYPELEATLGTLAKTLPLTFPLAPETTGTVALRAASAAVTEALSWEEYFAADNDTIEAALPYRFAFEEAPRTLGDTGFQLATLTAHTAPFLLCLRAYHQAGPLALELTFDAERFHREDIVRLGTFYLTLLTALAQQPDTPIAQLGLLPDDERQRVLVRENQTAQLFPFVAVPQQFEAAAAATPDAIALVVEDEQLTYAELNARANQVAAILGQRGVGPEQVVGLCLERSVALMVGMLGILKAGAAYLPLDPSLPRERLLNMLQDSQASQLVTRAADAERLALPVTTLCLDRDSALLAAASTANPGTALVGENLAYVIYTSGSTGKPKGVAIEHRNLANYVAAIAQKLALPAGASYATVSTPAADLGHTAVFPSLCGGGCLHVISSACAMDTQQWRSYFATHRIDCLKIVPSHLAALLGDATELGALLPQRVLVLGGEASHPELIERLQAGTPHLRLLNHYGPTETTVGVLTYPITRPSAFLEQGAVTVPIGKPLPNSQAYVLDSYRQPVPQGFVGELYIGGAGVGRGYLNQPELTAERFIASPFGDGRLYRTGDRVRQLADGNIEFLGRVDHQVKIRGYRIELGEIENTLRDYPGIREAVVLAREDMPGEKRLVAYVVARNGSLPLDAVRTHLQAQLPEFMVPSALVPLPRLPLNANGKIDRNALPAPAPGGEGSTYIAPRTALEQTLETIWKGLLRRERISIHDSFFDLGGHSLMALQVISRLRDALQKEVPVQALFEAPTIAQLAARLEGASERRARPALVPVARTEALPLSFSQQRLWFIDQLEPGSHLYNVSTAILLSGPLDTGALHQALETIVTRHEILRTTYPSHNGAPTQRIAPPGPLAFPCTNLSALPEAERATEARRLADTEAQRPFDLAEGPLFRASLVCLANDEHLLLLTLHHIASDGWSRGVLLRELSALYIDFAAGKTPSLPALPLQYADYAAWQRSWLQGEELEHQLTYWRTRLATAPPVLELPTDRPRGDVVPVDGAWERSLLSPELVAQITALGHEENATLFMTLLSAYAILLGRFARTNDIVLGTDVANRNAQELEGLIGFFLNHIVLRTDLSEATSFRSLLRTVRQQTMEAFDHQEMPFDKLVEVLNPERRGNHTPLFQLLFVLQNQPRVPLELPGITASPFRTPHEVSKYDLSLFLSERPDGLAVGFLYRKALFDATTIALLCGRFQTLLESIVAHPDEPIASLEQTPAAEKQALEEQRTSKLAQLRSTTRRATSVSSSD